MKWKIVIMYTGCRCISSLPNGDRHVDLTAIATVVHWIGDRSETCKTYENVRVKH